MPAFASVLTYHSQNIDFPRPGHNDHLALAADLEALHAAGFRLLPLTRLADVLDGSAAPDELAQAVFLTFDDGCDMDVRDVDYPQAGPQRGFLGIMQDFVARHGADAQPGLHASSFVIASPEARAAIDRGSLFGRGWIGEDWWRAANRGGLLAIENHGWDHFHPDARPQADGQTGTATTDSECELQVLRSAGYIERASGRRPQFFAYPFGQAGTLLPDNWLPAQQGRHGLRAAFGTEPGFVTASSPRWTLPRWVCGRDWHGSAGLVELLRGRP